MGVDDEDHDELFTISRTLLERSPEATVVQPEVAVDVGEAAPYVTRWGRELCT